MNTMLEQTHDEGPTSQQQPALRDSRPSSPSRVRRIRPPVEAFGLTHTGLARATNEDCYLVHPELGLYAVADGMGGRPAGEVASQMAIDAVREDVEDSGALHPAHGGALLLLGGVEVANALIHATAQSDPFKRGMGTTLTGVVVFGRRIAIAHVGDSRVYRLRGACFEAMTQDHTVVAALVQAGAITLEEAATSELRSKLVRAVGIEERVAVDTRLDATEPGDVYLLSTDGLHGVVGDKDIATVLLAEHDLTRAAQELIECALDEGGPDNVTVVLVRIGGERGEAPNHVAPGE
jgi:serine/threonine protein phosphatase PrpC